MISIGLCSFLWAFLLMAGRACSGSAFAAVLVTAPGLTDTSLTLTPSRRMHCALWTAAANGRSCGQLFYKQSAGLAPVCRSLSPFSSYGVLVCFQRGILVRAWIMSGMIWFTVLYTFRQALLSGRFRDFRLMQCRIRDRLLSATLNQVSFFSWACCSGYAKNVS